MDDWLPEYERHVIESCTGPGTYVGGTSWRMVAHSTESGPGSMNALISFFSGRPCSTPHFGIDPSDRRRVQFIRLGYASAALKNVRGGVETNRAHAVQTEIVGRAAETQNWPDEWLQFLGEHVAALVQAGVPLNLQNFPQFVGLESGSIARPDAPQRMGYNEWNAFDGSCGHQHVPENDHWDPGRINWGRVIQHAEAILDGSSTPGPVPPPPPTPPVQRTLGRGDIGQDVHDWQTRLAGRGYWIAADGQFGELTEGITEWFQEGRGIAVDGLVGPRTRSEMNAAEEENWVPSLGGDGGTSTPPPPPPVTIPVWDGRYLMVQSPLITGGDVTAWQTQMENRGWAISVDGVFGEQSRSVAESFQTEKGLAVDGIVGPTTWTKAWTAPVT